jgi:hypothetical protein
VAATVADVALAGDDYTLDALRAHGVERVRFGVEPTVIDDIQMKRYVRPRGPECVVSRGEAADRLRKLRRIWPINDNRHGDALIFAVWHEGCIHVEYNSVLQQHLFLWQEHTKKLKFAEDTHIEQAAFLLLRAKTTSKRRLLYVHQARGLPSCAPARWETFLDCQLTVSCMLRNLNALSRLSESICGMKGTC